MIKKNKQFEQELTEAVIKAVKYGEKFSYLQINASNGTILHSSTIPDATFEQELTEAVIKAVKTAVALPYEIEEIVIRVS